MRTLEDLLAQRLFRERRIGVYDVHVDDLFREHLLESVFRRTYLCRVRGSDGNLHAEILSRQFPDRNRLARSAFLG